MKITVTAEQNTYSTPNVFNQIHQRLTKEATLAAQEFELFTNSYIQFISSGETKLTAKLEEKKVCSWCTMQIITLERARIVAVRGVKVRWL